MSNCRLFIFIATSILLFSCSKDQNQSIEQTLSGKYAKIWLIRDKKVNSFRGGSYGTGLIYYYVFFKSGKTKYMLLNLDWGVFSGYFSSGLSGDVLNSDYEWYIKADTLSIMGSKYKIKSISRSKDTILLEEVGSSHYQYYLINSNLLTH